MKPTLSFDALTLHAVTDELRATILGARVQKIVLVDPQTLVLELYGRGGRRQLLISCDPHAARVCLTDSRPSRTSETVTPLLLLLRKYVRGGRVEAVNQPPLERLLELHFATPRDSPDSEHRVPASPVRVRLIIEVMGRRSNAILVSDDGAIVDALRRASRQKNPVRPILPHLRYDPPPPQDRLDPWSDDTWDRLRELPPGQPEKTLAELLGERLRGFSPLIAREASFRAVGQPGASAATADWPGVRAAVAELLAPARGQALWSPSVARWGEGVVAFAAYRLRHLEGECAVMDVDHISAAIELAHVPRPSTPMSGVTPHLIAPLLQGIDARRSSVERRRAALIRAREAAGDPDELRHAGETILGFAHAIEPGQELLDVDGRPIRLDPTMNPIENAQRYFREYRKARDASRNVPQLVGQADRELAYLDEMRTLTEFADNPDRVRGLRAELTSTRVLADRAPERRRRGPVPSARPLSLPLADGFTALVGTSAQSNERVTFDLASQEDVWLHARQLPGAHVVVRTAGRPLSRPALIEAAQLAAHFSRGRDSGRVAVDWTLRKHVRKLRKGPPGLVTYVDEQTVDVAPQPPSPPGTGSG